MILHLVRHASAGRRNNVDPDDIERHLDPGGLEVAAEIADRLGSSPIAGIHSSRAPRCVETVQPLADRLGRAVNIAPELLEGSDVDAAWSLMERLADGVGDMVLCSHGDIIPEVIGRARRRGAELNGSLACRKGSIWSLEWHDGGVVSGHYWAPAKVGSDRTG